MPPIFYTYGKEALIKDRKDFGLVECKNASYLNIYGFDTIVVKGNILSPLSYINAYLEPNVPKIHPALTIKRYPKENKLCGKTLCLATMGAQTAYGEWVVNLIPRIAILEHFGYYFEDFDNIILNYDGLDWQNQLIELIKIPKEKIIPVKKGVHYKMDVMVAPTYSPHSMIGFQFIQNRLVRPFTNASSKPSKRIYLSRKNDKRLRIFNENELIELLENYNFEILDITKMKISEQIRFMDDVEFLISCQGSGLTNVLFMKSNTKVIEIHNSGLPNPHFNHYGIYKNIKYYNFMADPVSKDNNESIEIYCDLSKMKLLIESVIDV